MYVYRMKRGLIVTYFVLTSLVLILIILRLWLAATSGIEFSTWDRLDWMNAFTQPLLAIAMIFNAVTFVTTKYVLNPGSEFLYYRYGKVKDTISLQEKFRVFRTKNAAAIILEQFKDGVMHQIAISNVKEINEIHNHLSGISAQLDRDLGYNFFVYKMNYNTAQKSMVLGIVFGALLLVSLPFISIFLLPLWLLPVLFVPAFALFIIYIRDRSNKIKDDALILYENGMIDYRRGKHKLELNLKNCDLTKSTFIIKSKTRYILELFDGETHTLKLDYFYVERFVENLQRIHAAVNNIEEQQVQIVNK